MVAVLLCTLWLGMLSSAATTSSNSLIATTSDLLMLSFSTSALMCLSMELMAKSKHLGFLDDLLFNVEQLATSRRRQHCWKFDHADHVFSRCFLQCLEAVGLNPRHHELTVGLAAICMTIERVHDSMQDLQIFQWHC